MTDDVNTLTLQLTEHVCILFLLKEPYFASMQVLRMCQYISKWQWYLLHWCWSSFVSFPNSPLQVCSFSQRPKVPVLMESLLPLAFMLVSLWQTGEEIFPLVLFVVICVLCFDIIQIEQCKCCGFCTTFDSLQEPNDKGGFKSDGVRERISCISLFILSALAAIGHC